VVSRGVHHRDALIAESSCLLEEEPLGRKGEAFTVEEVTRDEKGVHVLPNREVDGALEGLSRGIAQTSTYRLGATRERGVEMDIGDVHETHVPN
jgi:hypothetical protein